MQKGLTKYLNICKVPELNRDYQNTIDFENVANQKSYFLNKRYTIVTGNYIIDSSRTSYIVEKSIENIQNCDYLYIYNDIEDKYYYYFILGMEYKTKTTTIIYVELDVFQTFLFDFNVMSSFVDRCHVKRWLDDGTPNKNEIVPEDLQLTAHVIMNRKQVYSYSDKGAYIITSTEPLGVVPDRRKVHQGTGGELQESNGNWKEGYMSANGFLFLKENEGFGKYVYDDGYGNSTVGYGVTSHGCPNEFNVLKNQQPLSEEVAAKVSYEASKNNFGSKIVNRCIELGISNQCQFDSIIDLIYNCGLGVINGTNSLTNALKTGNRDTIKTVWESFYITANGVYVPSLKNRRIAEVNLFLNGTYPSFKGIGVYNAKRVNIGTVTENNGKGWLPEETNDNNGNYTGTMIKNQYGEGAIPTHGQCTATFPRYPSGGAHSGVDVANAEGTKIFSWCDGVVKWVGLGYGLGVCIDNSEKGCSVIYGHNSKVLVNVGDKVKMGDNIALMGSSGNSTGNHLHFEVRPIGGSISSAINPWENIKVGDKV